MTLTTDPKDERLRETLPSGQQKAYLVLSADERAKGFVRPVRTVYQHLGTPGPSFPLRDLTDEERARYADPPYVKFEPYPESRQPLTGRFWTQAQLDAVGPCGAWTQMGLALAATYARDPKFYGATFCVRCGRHVPVSECRWEDGTEVGS